MSALNLAGNDQGVRWVKVHNESGEVIPAGGLMRVTGLDKDNGWFTVDKPDADGQSGLLVNDRNVIEVDSEGQGCRADPFFIAFDPATGTPANGETWGSQVDSWYAVSGNSGWVIYGDGLDGLANASREDGGGGAGGKLVDNVHIVAGPTYPADPDDPQPGESADDVFARAVFLDTDDVLREVDPAREYGLGDVSGDLTGTIYEHSFRPFRRADPDDDSGIASHVIPLYRDNAPADEAGPIYFVQWPKWGNTFTREELVDPWFSFSQDAVTCKITATPTLENYDYTLKFDSALNLVFTITVSP